MKKIFSVIVLTFLLLSSVNIVSATEGNQEQERTNLLQGLKYYVVGLANIDAPLVPTKDFPDVWYNPTMSAALTDNLDDTEFRFSAGVNNVIIRFVEPKNIKEYRIYNADSERITKLKMYNTNLDLLFDGAVNGNDSTYHNTDIPEVKYISLVVHGNYKDIYFSDNDSGEPEPEPEPTPEVPQQPPTVESGNGSVTISWQATEGATSYNIYRNNELITTVDGSKLSYRDDSVINGQTYQYEVIAVVDGVEHPYNPPPNPVKPTPTPPQPPTVESGNGSVTISWQATEGATSYNIYRNNELITTVDGSILSYTDSNVINNQTYQYEVVAVVDGVELPYNPPPRPAKPSEQMQFDFVFVGADDAMKTALNFLNSTKIGMFLILIAGVYIGYVIMSFLFKILGITTKKNFKEQNKEERRTKSTNNWANVDENSKRAEGLLTSKDKRLLSQIDNDKERDGWKSYMIRARLERRQYGAGYGDRNIERTIRRDRESRGLTFPSDNAGRQREGRTTQRTGRR